MKSLLLLLLLAGCVSNPPVPTPGCLPLKTWTPGDQDKLLAEYKHLVPDSKMVVAFDDYVKLRNEIKACQRSLSTKKVL